MKIKINAALLAAFLLAGCNLPTRSLPVTPTGDPVATQVSRLLTQSPTQTAAPTLTAAPTETSVPPTETAPAATATAAMAATATAAAAAVTTPLPTPTTLAGDPKASLGEPTWRSTLDSTNIFYQYENENTKVAIENGALVLTGLSNNGWLGWSLTYSNPAQNFYLEGVFSPQTCSGADLYGLVFRSANNDSGYFYGLTCDGRFNLHARDFKDGTDKVLVDLTPASPIQMGSNSVNRAGVWVNGSDIKLYANGSLLKEITDDTFKEKGNFGAIVAANNTSGFTVKMDEISLWVLP